MFSIIYRTFALAAAAAFVLTVSLPPARADHDDHHGRGWREHEWREHHHYRGPPRVYYQPGYYAPPPVVYAPPPPPPVFYAPPAIVVPPSLNITIPLR